jgi:predicted nucleotidyltransferase
MKTPPTDIEAIIRKIRDIRSDLARFGVGQIGLFGSFIRNEQTPDSDIDILIDFLPGQHTFDNFMDVSLLLEKILGRRVDLVTRESLSPYIGPHILKEVRHVDIAA